MTHTLLTAALTLALLPAAQADRGAEVKRLMQPVIDAGIVPGAVVGIDTQISHSFEDLYSCAVEYGKQRGNHGNK